MSAPRLSRGPKFLQSAFNGLADYVESIVPIAGSGISISDSETGKGRFISSNNSGGGGAGGSEPAPFSVYRVEVDGGPGIGVRFGVVKPYKSAEGLLPWPSDFNDGSDYKYEFSIEASDGAVWIEIVNDITGSFYKTSSISMGVNIGAIDIPVDDDTTMYLPVGVWRYVDDKLKILFGAGEEGIGNQEYNFVGYAHLAGPL